MLDLIKRVIGRRSRKQHPPTEIHVGVWDGTKLRLVRKEFFQGGIAKLKFESAKHAGWRLLAQAFRGALQPEEILAEKIECNGRWVVCAVGFLNQSREALIQDKGRDKVLVTLEQVKRSETSPIAPIAQHMQGMVDRYMVEHAPHITVATR